MFQKVDILKDELLDEEGALLAAGDQTIVAGVEDAGDGAGAGDETKPESPGLLTDEDDDSEK